MLGLFPPPPPPEAKKTVVPSKHTRQRMKSKSITEEEGGNSSTMDLLLSLSLCLACLPTDFLGGSLAIVGGAVRVVGGKGVDWPSSCSGGDPGTNDEATRDAVKV